MLLAGSIFVLIEIIINKSKAFSVFSSARNIFDLIVYTLTIIGTQFTFFLCIQYSNASFAAVLTATDPLFVMLALAIFAHKKLSLKEIICGFVVVIGVFLVATGGSLSSFNVSTVGLIAGLGSGITGAAYILLPQKLIRRVGSGVATSWALLLTGVSVSLFSHFWSEPLQWSWQAVAAYSYIVIFGTILSFWLFQTAVEMIAPDIAAMVETLDPVAATTLAILFLHLSLNMWEVVGGILILGTVVVLAVPTKHPAHLGKHKQISDLLTRDTNTTK